MTVGDKLFSRRLRALLDEKRVTQAELAEKADLAPSLISKLAAESEESRREPRLEHVFAIARALEMPPRELVVGTTAEVLLDEWVPRDELQAEAQARAEAQAAAAALRTELAGARREIEELKGEIDQTLKKLAAAMQQSTDLEAINRKERTARGVAESKLAAAITERDHALAEAKASYKALVNLHSLHKKVVRELFEAKANLSEAKANAAEGKWISALLGGLVGAGAVAMTADTKKSKRRRR